MHSFFKTAFLSSAMMIGGSGLLHTAAQAQELNPTTPVIDFAYSESPDDHVLGAVDAPHTLIVYASVTCSHCSDWFIHEWDAVKQNLINTGQLRLVFREFPTPPAQVAAIGFALANCASDATYFDAIEYQMEQQPAIFEGLQAGKQRETFLKIAAQSGLDTEEAMLSCLQDPANTEPITRSRDRGIASGIDGVPAFFLNGVRYRGEQSATAIAAAMAQN